MNSIKNISIKQFLAEQGDLLTKLASTDILKYRIEVRFATEEYFLLKTNARTARLTISDFIRSALRSCEVKERLTATHPHVHLIMNRIDFNGKRISDQNERIRSTKICKALTLKRGLYVSSGKENVKRERLREPEAEMLNH